MRYVLPMSSLGKNTVFNYILSFVESHGVVDTKKNIVLAISGGLDSVFLSYFLKFLHGKKVVNNVYLLYIDHSTRPEEIKKEKDFLNKLARSFNFEFFVEKIELNLDQANFEARARQARYEIYRNYAHKYNAHIYLGHHIDDSFEWSLMQQFKSSDSNSSLGIPIKNGIYRRPLMCLTKKQLISIARFQGIKYLTDSSNYNFKFERNYLREKIISEIKKKYPQYLKHYVERSNRIAMEKGLHCFSSAEAGASDNYKKVYLNKGVILIYQKNFSSQFLGAKQLILKSIYELSQNKRGQIQQQLNKLIAATTKGKSGPMTFSGNVTVFMIPGGILLFNKESKNALQSWDTSLSKEINNIVTIEELKNEKVFAPKSLNDLIVVQNSNDAWPKNKQFKPLRSVHPLMPHGSKYFLDNNFHWQWATKFFALSLNL